MKRLLLIFGISLLTSSLTHAGYNVGDKASDFKLKNVDGKYVSLKDYSNAKGFIVIFTCNHCPYAQAYQDRIIKIDQNYKSKGYPVIAINPNDPQLQPDDSYENMVTRAKEKGFTFPYLYDNDQEVYRKYGATRTPHVFLLQKEGNDIVVRYIGAIDDNYQDASMVTSSYLTNAIDALLNGGTPNLTFTKAIGCSIKDKQSKT